MDTSRDPEETTAAGAPAPAEISPAARMGAVHLVVSNLQRSVAYYESVIGLIVHERADARAVLGAGGEDLLVLLEQPGARPARGYCGLYHFALLLPQRADLARWLLHALREQIALVGLADHYVSEAIYLSDPDAHGIEIYWDRPREVWEGKVAERMTTLSLDTSSLFDELSDPASEPFDRLPVGTVMGHVHLCVADIPQTLAFYRDVLGFALMASLGGQAAFLGAGGYHHHIGANTWESAGAGPPPPGMATLRQATIVLPTQLARDRLLTRLSDAGYEPREPGYEPRGLEHGVLVRDPCGNPIAITALTG